MHITAVAIYSCKLRLKIALLQSHLKHVQKDYSPKFQGGRVHQILVSIEACSNATGNMQVSNATHNCESLFLHFRCLEYADCLILYFRKLYLGTIRFSNIMTNTTITMINHNHNSPFNHKQHQHYRTRPRTCGVGHDYWHSVLSMV